MALVKIKDFDSNYAETLRDKDIIHYSVYSNITDEKIGTVEDILVDEETGHFRYFIVDIGFWIFGKKILLPIEYSQIRFSDKRIDAKGLTKEQAEQLPEFDESLRINNDYEDRVSAIYPPRSLNSLNTVDPLGNPVSPVVPFSPITIGTLASLTSPTVPPYAGDPSSPLDREERDRR